MSRIKRTIIIVNFKYNVSTVTYLKPVFALFHRPNEFSHSQDHDLDISLFLTRNSRNRIYIYIYIHRISWTCTILGWGSENTRETCIWNSMLLKNCLKLEFHIRYLIYMYISLCLCNTICSLNITDMCFLYRFGK